MISEADELLLLLTRLINRQDVVFDDLVTVCKCV